ncbi:ORF1 [Atractylodes mild mottle virus]|uniref:Movement protein n=1 Tax=Atractylodes mild mottle virus TaxID=1711685 RepID=A0A0M4ISU5_9VIRU|nr:ORF1 [Atractylodes mild mottle virus]ALD49086.1 ORF1 [Atractylodes mild mottle virus]
MSLEKSKGHNFDSDHSEEQSQITFCENDKGFCGNLLINQATLKQVNRINLGLKVDDVFKTSKLCQFFKRKNQIYYHVSTKEVHVDIVDTKGSVYLPLITREEVNNNLRHLKSEVRSKISTIHLGAVKILIKAEFQAGIDSPIKMALIDNRINDRKDCILGAARGNLCYQKFMFTVYPKYDISIKTKNLDQVLSFVHHFEREDLMNPGDKVFSLTYLVGYALANSVHSVDYKHQEYIELDQVFSEVGQIEEKQFSDIKPMDTSWAIDIARGKRIMGKNLNPEVKGTTLHVGSSTSVAKPTSEISLIDISNKIDEFGNTLKSIL